MSTAAPVFQSVAASAPAAAPGRIEDMPPVEPATGGGKPDAPAAQETPEQLRRERDMLRQQAELYKASLDERAAAMKLMQEERTANLANRVSGIHADLTEAIQASDASADLYNTMLTDHSMRAGIDVLCSIDAKYKATQGELEAARKQLEESKAAQAAADARLAKLERDLQTSEVHASGLATLAMRNAAAATASPSLAAQLQAEEEAAEDSDGLSYLPQSASGAPGLGFNPLTTRMRADPYAHTEGQVSNQFRLMFMGPETRKRIANPAVEVSASGRAPAKAQQRAGFFRAREPEEGGSAAPGATSLFSVGAAINEQELLLTASANAKAAAAAALPSAVGGGQPQHEAQQHTAASVRTTPAPAHKAPTINPGLAEIQRIVDLANYGPPKSVYPIPEHLLPQHAAHAGPSERTMRRRAGVHY